MELLQGVVYEYHYLINRNGYRVANILVDSARAFIFPVGVIDRMGWELETVTTDQQEIVRHVNEHPNPCGPLFADDAHINPNLFITHKFWTCRCPSAFVHHNNCTMCPHCGETKDQARGVAYFEIIARELELRLDAWEITQGLHILH